MNPFSAWTADDCDKHNARVAAARAKGAGTAPKLEQHPCDGALAAPQIQVPATGRFLVRVVSVRKRLLDEDNLCEKYHIDLLRYASVIPSDAPDQTHIEVHQVKARKGEEEYTQIEVYEQT